MRRASSAARRTHDPTAADDWRTVADDFEAIYRRLLARRHDPTGDPELRATLASRPLIEVDLHMHTDHSGDCATPVEVLLQTARDRGPRGDRDHRPQRGHGALEAARSPRRWPDLKVIVGEEVKTAEQGEVIGLFLKEKIPKGLTMAETIAAIREQGGLVYVPHPFDRLHSVPDYEHLLDIVEEVDLLEVFNPRVAMSAFNEEAVRFAGKYRIIPAPARTPTWLRVWARCASGSTTSMGPRSSSRRCGTPTSPASQEPDLRADAEVPADDGRGRRRPAATGACGVPAGRGGARR